MAKATLPTNYQDDILNVSTEGKRKYRMVYNDDGTVSFEDVTPYDQEGSDFGAGDINATNEAVNQSLDKAKVIDDLETIQAVTKEGFVMGALAGKALNESLQNVGLNITHIKTFSGYTSSAGTNVTISNISGYKALCIIGTQGGITVDVSHVVPMEFFKLGMAIRCGYAKSNVMKDGSEIKYVSNTSVNVKNISGDLRLYGIK